MTSNDVFYIYTLTRCFDEIVLTKHARARVCVSSVELENFLIKFQFYRKFFPNDAESRDKSNGNNILVSFCLFSKRNFTFLEIYRVSMPLKITSISLDFSIESITWRIYTFPAEKLAILETSQSLPLGEQRRTVCYRNCIRNIVPGLELSIKKNFRSP